MLQTETELKLNADALRRMTSKRDEIRDELKRLHQQHEQIRTKVQKLQFDIKGA